MKIYQYKALVGTFIIKPQSNDRWGLWLNDDLLGSYHSPIAAADDVYTQSTGDFDWDTYNIFDTDILVDIPTDIYEWEMVSR